MFSPLNDPHIEDWFQRLNAPLKRLPADERTQLHLEVRQHLDALAAANEELGSSPDEARRFALEQFGDPGKFGRQMLREAMTLGPDPNQWAKKPLMAAWMYCSVVSLLGVGAIWTVWMACLGLLWTFAPMLSESSLLSILVSNFVGAGMLAASVLGGWLTGRKMKSHALAGAVCALFSLSVPDTLLLLLVDHDVPGGFKFSAWAISGCVSAYFASVTKRGWYNPMWEDLKITLLKRWQIAK